MFQTRSRQPRRLARREALRAAALGGLALSFVPACSGGKRAGGPATPTAGRGGTPSPTLPPGETTPGRGSAAETNGRPGGTLALAMPGVPAGFDPVAQNAALTPAFVALACNGLLAPRNGNARVPDPADTALVPDLAAAMPEQPDATTYLFHLRPEARWQQTAPVGGRPFIATDVQAHFSRALGERSALKLALAPLERVEAVDDHTVRFVLKAAYAPFLALIAGGPDRFILPRETAQAGTSRTLLIGTGPFLLAQHTPGQPDIFSRNAAYWKRDARGTALPYLDGLSWLSLPDAAARVQALQARQALVSAALEPAAFDQLRASNANDFDFEEAPGVADALFMRVDRPPFNDKRVRQALSLAIDRPALIQALGKGHGVTDLPIPALLRLPPLPDGPGQPGRLFTRDIQAARQLLAAAGVPSGLQTTLTFTPQYGATFVQEASLLRGYLHEIGIEATPHQVDYAAYLSTAFVGRFEGLALGQRQPHADADPYLSDVYVPGAIGYQDGSNDAALQALIARQRAELDGAARLALLGQIQGYLADAAYRVYPPAIGHGYARAKAMRNWRGSEWPAAALEAAWLQA
ncbi:MAG TPA: ABC transporter substrate-binding protein [Dehalococcoidia bacterium]|nr:ABC transporter substrate-binding protein [Dehalococcoidia bacterium]